MESPLWCSVVRAIFAERKHDSLDFSLSYYCTDLKRVKFLEEGGTSETLEAEVPLYNSNENKNLEEVSG